MTTPEKSAFDKMVEGHTLRAAEKAMRSPKIRNRISEIIRDVLTEIVHVRDFIVTHNTHCTHCGSGPWGDGWMANGLCQNCTGAD